MAINTEEKSSNYDEISLIEIWNKFTHVFSRYKFFILGTSCLFMFAGFGLLKPPHPQWEGAAVMQLGRVSTSEHIESFENLSWRMGTVEFQESVLKKTGISLTSPEAALYQNSLNIKQISGTDLIALTVRGLSRESVVKLLSVTDSAILSAHTARIPKLNPGPKRHLAVIEKLNQDVAATLKVSQQPSSENKLLADIVAAYVVRETGEVKFTLQDQIDFPELHPTTLLEERVGSNPVPQKKYQRMVFFTVFGFFLAIAVSIALNSSGVSNRHS